MRFERRASVPPALLVAAPHRAGAGGYMRLPA